jgi:transketolase
MRNAFIDELCALAAANPRIALVVGDLGFSVVEPFADRFPDRFINAGVAEQNMTSLSAGMASEGYQVFAYSIANFPTFRCAEQIRNDVAYHNLPVTMVTVGGGLAYGALGYSHHAVQDYSLMRLFPNLLIAAPGDPMEVRACLRYFAAHPQPSYLRLGKAGEPNFHAAAPALKPGQWLTVREGASSDTVLTTGAALGAAMGWVKDRPERTHRICSLPLWGMGTKFAQIEQAQAATSIVTLEDHLRDGGFGSWMMEALSVRPDLLARLRSVALDARVTGMVASQNALNLLGGLTADAVFGDEPAVKA